MAKFILKIHKNQVLKEIQIQKLNPVDFRWGNAYSVCAAGRFEVTKLIHIPTEYYFLFDYTHDNEHWAVFSPGIEKAVQSEHTCIWDVQYAFVIQWLSYLKQEVEAPDLWATIGQESALAETVFYKDQANEMFNENEKKILSIQLNEVKKYVAKTITLSQEQYDILNSKLDYLIDASNRLTKKDWITIAAGVFLSAAAGNIIPPTTIKDFLRFVAVALNNVFGTIQLFLPK